MKVGRVIFGLAIPVALAFTVAAVVFFARPGKPSQPRSIPTPTFKVGDRVQVVGRIYSGFPTLGAALSAYRDHLRRLQAAENAAQEWCGIATSAWGRLSSASTNRERAETAQLLLKCQTLKQTAETLTTNGPGTEIISGMRLYATVTSAEWVGDTYLYGVEHGKSKAKLATAYVFGVHLRRVPTERK